MLLRHRSLCVRKPSRVSVGRFLWQQWGGRWTTGTTVGITPVGGTARSPGLDCGCGHLLRSWAAEVTEPRCNQVLSLV